MPKPLTAHKHRGLATNYDHWLPYHDRRIVMYGIESLGAVETTAGPMVKVRLKQKVEFININQDVAVLLGKLQLPTSTPDLYYWNDKYWLQALDSSSEWYKGQCHLLYEVPITVTDDYIAQLSSEREQAAVKKPK